jgi:FolB domain-containing protein
MLSLELVFRAEIVASISGFEKDVGTAQIEIDQIHARGILGVDEWEREHRQDILVSTTLTIDAGDVSRTDRVEDTVNYRSLTKDIRNHVESAERRTVEALAEDIADLCLERDLVDEATVSVEKPDALRDADAVRVSITRT